MPQHLRQEPSAVVLRAGICAGGAGQPASLPQTERPGPDSLVWPANPDRVVGVRLGTDKP